MDPPPNFNDCGEFAPRVKRAVHVNINDLVGFPELWSAVSSSRRLFRHINGVGAVFSWFFSRVLCGSLGLTHASHFDEVASLSFSIFDYLLTFFHQCLENDHVVTFPTNLGAFFTDTACSTSYYYGFADFGFLF
jgi:hypothetical protein